MEVSERKIPIVTAIIALAFFSLVIFGISAVIIAHIGAAGEGDVGLHLDGTWDIASPTFNDEAIRFVFDGAAFSNITESVIFDATPEILDDIREFHMTHSNAAVNTQHMGGANYLLRIHTDGTFVLDGNSILLVM